MNTQLVTFKVNFKIHSKQQITTK